MVVERQNQEIIIRLDGSVIDIREVQRFVDYLRFMESNAKNKGTEEQAAQLAREVHGQWWQKNKQRLLP